MAQFLSHSRCHPSNARGVQGTALFLVLVMFLLLSAVGLAILLLINNHFVQTHEMYVRLQSMYLVEAGLSHVQWEGKTNWDDPFSAYNYSFSEGGQTIEIQAGAVDGSGKRLVTISTTYQTIENL